jgi:hypothetical protein
MCGKVFQKGWLYFVNQTTSTAHACAECADALLD